MPGPHDELPEPVSEPPRPHDELPEPIDRPLESVDEPPGPYAKLPEPIDLDRVVTSADTEPVPDPDGGRDPERDFMLRWAGWG